jgi:DNA-binding transcriptional regulator YdaS (Cro superfamily)
MVDGKKAVLSLKGRARDKKVSLLDAVLLANLHPSNLSKWSRGVHSVRARNVVEIEVAIDLLAEELRNTA